MLFTEAQHLNDGHTISYFEATEKLSEQLLIFFLLLAHFKTIGFHHEKNSLYWRDSSHYRTSAPASKENSNTMTSMLNIETNVF